MRPDFQIDIFWASSVRSKLAQRLSAVAVSGEISNFGRAHLFLYGRQPFCMRDSHLICSPPTTAQFCVVKASKQACLGFQGFEPAQKINSRICLPIGLFRHDDGRARAAKIAYIHNLAVNNMVRFIKVKVSYNEFPF